MVLVPCFSFGPFDAFAVRRGSTGAWWLRFGFGRLCFDDVRWAALQSLDPCGVVGILCSSLPLLDLLCCAGLCQLLSFLRSGLCGGTHAWVMMWWPVLLAKFRIVVRAFLVSQCCALLALWLLAVRLFVTLYSSCTWHDYYTVLAPLVNSL